jgi:hypothetical protein
MSGSVTDPGSPASMDPAGPQFLNGMFSNPTIAGLLGAAGGFAQAAMPSRMPVPMGAAIGMAGQGLMQGAASAQDYRKQQLANQAAAMQNQYNAAFLPDKMLAMREALGGVAANPSQPTEATTPQIANGGGAGSGSGSGSGSGDGGSAGIPFGRPGALSIPQQIAFLKMALINGDGRTASTILSNLQQQAGGAGYRLNADGTSTFVPGGSADPGTRFGLSQAEAAGKVGPEETLEQFKTGQANDRTTFNTNADLFQKYNTPTTQDGVTGSPTQRGMPTPTYNPAGVATVPGVSAAPVQSTNPFPQWARQIQQRENPTGNPGEKNPNSSAAGNGQFIDNTWINQVASARPDLVQGRSRQEILALRNDPQISDQVTADYARQNAGVLQQNGLPITGPNIGVMHQFGPGAGSAILRANPTTPAAMLLPRNVIEANNLQGKTTGDIVGDARRYMAPPQQQPTQLAPGVQQSPGPGGSIVTTNTRPQQNQMMMDDMKHSDEASDEINAGQNYIAQMQHARDIAAQLPTSGANADSRMAMANYVATYMPQLKDSWLTRAAKLPDAALAQEFTKFNVANAGADDKGTMGSHAGVAALKIFQGANPGFGLQPKANQDMANVKMIMKQGDIDYAQGLQDHINNARQAYVSGQSDYVPSTEYDRQWNKQRNPQVYGAAMSAMTGAPFAKWSKGLSKAEGLRALQVIGRVDPNATVPGEDGRPWPVATFMPQQTAGTN